jgi:methionyl-tRNA formyltransferase
MKILLAGRKDLLEAVLICVVNLFRNKNIGIISSPGKLQNTKKTKEIIKKNKIKNFIENKDNSLNNIIKNFKPEIFISCGYDKVIKKKIIKEIIFPINIHFADLPKYKGFFCIPHAIRNEEKRIGITIHYINERVDSGEIISKKYIKNLVKYSAKDLYLKAIDIVMIEITKIMKLIKKDGKIEGKKQHGTASFYGKNSLQKYELSFEDNYMKIVNYIRSFHFPPFSGLKFYCGNLNFNFIYPLEFKKAKVNDFGKLIRINNKFYLQCKNGILFPKYVNFNNKKTSFNKLIKKFNLLKKKFHFVKQS